MQTTAYSAKIGILSPCLKTNGRKILQTRSRSKIMATFMTFILESRGEGIESVISDA